MAMRKLPRPAGYHFDQKEAVIHPDGRRGCRWCRKPVPKRNRKWCGDPQCVLEWTRRTQPAVFRQVIFDRDRGICAACHLDTRRFDLKRLNTQLYLTRSAMLRSDASWRRWTPAPETDLLSRLYEPEFWLHLIDEAVRWRVVNRIDQNRSPWEADHIIPISEGGDWFDMANIQSLCIPCHKLMTAKLAGRRADRRRSTLHPGISP